VSKILPAPSAPPSFRLALRGQHLKPALLPIAVADIPTPPPTEAPCPPHPNTQEVHEYDAEQRAYECTKHLRFRGMASRSVAGADRRGVVIRFCRTRFVFELSNFSFQAKRLHRYFDEFGCGLNKRMPKPDRRDMTLKEVRGCGCCARSLRVFSRVEKEE
jgi:hypothetical protein